MGKDIYGCTATESSSRASGGIGEVGHRVVSRGRGTDAAHRRAEGHPILYEAIGPGHVPGAGTVQRGLDIYRVAAANRTAAADTCRRINARDRDDKVDLSGAIGESVIVTGRRSAKSRRTTEA